MKDPKNQILIATCNQDGKSSVGKQQILAPVLGDKQDALLQTIRTLWSPLEALQLQQQTLHDTLTELKTTKNKIGGGAPIGGGALSTCLDSGSGHPISDTVI